MNELLWAAMLLACFAGILLAYRLFGRMGLYAWIPIATIVANIQVMKFVPLFGISVTLGNIVYASSFLVTDILSENYGRKCAQKAVAVGFFSLIAMTLLMNLSIHFAPTSFDQHHAHIEAIFGLMPRLAIASLAAYLLAQLHDVWAYQWWRKRLPGTRHIWLRNNASTMISQLIDTLVFCTIAFSGIWFLEPQAPLSELWSIFWTTYVLKWVVAAADTPFVYIARLMHDKGWKGKDDEPMHPNDAGRTDG